MALKHEVVKVREIIDDYRKGRLVIPEFQRDYVWPPSKASKLLDSLYHKYPISSLLIWESTEKVEARRLEPRRDRGIGVGYLVDGQQRIITVSRAFSGDENIDVMFNTGNEKFTRANAANRGDIRWIRVSDAWQDDWYRDYRKRLPENRAGKEAEERLDRLRGILDYEIPVVKMIGDNFEDAVEAFTRINRYGTPLKKHDIENAHVAAKHPGFIRNKVVPFVETLDKRGYERLAATHLLRACAFVATEDRRRTPLNELETRDLESAWRKTEKGVEAALGLIAGELGVANMNVLWSGSLLVPLIALCAVTPVKERNDQELVGWLAVATLCKRYSRSSGTMLDQDLKACRKEDPIGALLSNLREKRPSLLATQHDFNGYLADRSGLFATYIACWQLGMKDLLSGGKVLARKLVDRHHILPRSMFPAGQASQRADVLANIAFIGPDSNKTISDTTPSRYLSEIPTEILQSQAIPLNPDLWDTAHSEEFWYERQCLLRDAFNAFLKRTLVKRRLDT